MIDTTNSLGSIGPKTTRSKVDTSATEAKTTSAPVSSPSPEASDQVVLSQEAKNASRLEAKVNAAPDVDLERVAELRRAIAEGRFDINPERIAENMLKQDELLG